MKTTASAGLSGHSGPQTTHRPPGMSRIGERYGVSFADSPHHQQRRSSTANVLVLTARPTEKLLPFAVQLRVDPVPLFTDGALDVDSGTAMIDRCELAGQVASRLGRFGKVDWDGETRHRLGAPADNADEGTADPRFANPHTERLTLMLRNGQRFDAPLHTATAGGEDHDALRSCFVGFSPRRLRCQWTPWVERSSTRAISRTERPASNSFWTSGAFVSGAFRSANSFASIR